MVHVSVVLSFKEAPFPLPRSTSAAATSQRHSPARELVWQDYRGLVYPGSRRFCFRLFLARGPRRSLSPLIVIFPVLSSRLFLGVASAVDVEQGAAAVGGTGASTTGACRAPPCGVYIRVQQCAFVRTTTFMHIFVPALDRVVPADQWKYVCIFTPCPKLVKSHQIQPFNSVARCLCVDVYQLCSFCLQVWYQPSNETRNPLRSGPPLCPRAPRGGGRTSRFHFRCPFLSFFSFSPVLFLSPAIKTTARDTDN